MTSDSVQKSRNLGGGHKTTLLRRLDMGNKRYLEEVHPSGVHVDPKTVAQPAPPAPAKPAAASAKPAPVPVKPAPVPAKPAPEPAKPAPTPAKPAPAPAKPAPATPPKPADNHATAANPANNKPPAPAVAATVHVDKIKTASVPAPNLAAEHTKPVHPIASEAHNHKTAPVHPPQNHLSHSWPENITHGQAWTLGLLPSLSFLLLVILLRVVWKKSKSSPRFMTISGHSREDETTTLSHGSHGKASDRKNEIIGTYESHWAQTCDSLLLTFMVVYGIVLTVLTFFHHPKLLFSLHFWMIQFLRIVTVILVALCGGYLCRHFCEIDVKGYIVTSRSNCFDVRYTQKLLYFVTCLIPLLNRTNHNQTFLALFWGDFCCLIPFIFMIKPIREQLSFFMLQFNALDCPEQRPYTLKWSVFGNIVPGMLALAFFKWLFHTQPSFVYLILLITSVGTFLSDIIGKVCGRHMYARNECLSGKTQLQSWESSACMFVYAMTLIASMYADFGSFTQVLVAMLVLSPLITYAQAIAPQSAQTPILIGVSGAILYAITFL